MTPPGQRVSRHAAGPHALRNLAGGPVVLGLGLGHFSDRGAALTAVRHPARPRCEQTDERLDPLQALLAGAIGGTGGGGSGGSG